jgi:general L-amino acid transport system permease protein
MLRNRNTRDILLQVLLVGGTLAVLALLVASTAANLRARGVPLGFAFLGDPAGFTIQDRIVAFGPTDSYARAVWVGITNTLLVAALVLPLASLAGLLVGIGRLSANPLAAGFCRVWVEIARNTPAIVLLLFVYGLWAQVLPPVRAALQVAPGTFLSQRGLVLPRIDPGFTTGEALLALAGLACIMFAAQRAARHRAVQRCGGIGGESLAQQGLRERRQRSRSGIPCGEEV